MAAAEQRRTRSAILFGVLLVVLVASIAAYSFSAASSVNSSSSSSSSLCSQPSGVVRTQLSVPSQFGEVTTYQLPQPLRAPNSIVAAPDGSVWFGEVTLRGIAHLFVNGTLLEYAFPSSFLSGAYCPDLSEFWGIALWHGLVWVSDSDNDQLVGLQPSNDTFSTIRLANGSMPRYLALDGQGRLWFTESSTDSEIGMVSSPSSAPVYFQVPAPSGEITASITFYNSSLAYVVTVNTSTNAGQVFSFDPSAAAPVFTQIGPGQPLLAPYSVAVADGGLWVGQHDSSELAFYNDSSGLWSYYPNSVNPHVQLTLPYYLIANGTSLWFNEHDSNKIAVISGTSSLTEYNISDVSVTVNGIGNALTLTLSHNLVWFTEWTGNVVGFVNASESPTFSVSAPVPTVSLAPGSSSSFALDVSGSSTSNLTVQFSDSEYHTAIPMNLSLSSNSTVLTALSGTDHLLVTVAAKAGTPAGQYLVLATVTDGLTYRSVYVTVTVT